MEIQYCSVTLITLLLMVLLMLLMITRPICRGSIHRKAAFSLVIGVHSFKNSHMFLHLILKLSTQQFIPSYCGRCIHSVVLGGCVCDIGTVDVLSLEKFLYFHKLDGVGVGVGHGSGLTTVM